MAKTTSTRDDRRRQRLVRAFQWSREQLEPYRSNRFQSVQEFVGAHYSNVPFGASAATVTQTRADRLVPVNFLELAVSIYRRQIAARRPAALVTTAFRELEASAARLELALNRLMDEIDFSRTLEDWVTDAMFSIGILKVGVTSGDQGEIEGFLHDAGQLFADVVDLDDWVHDMTARRYEQVQYAGNRFRLHKEFVLDSGEFDVDERTINQIGGFRNTNEQGDERIRQIGQDVGGHSSLENEFEETVELWELWIPRDNVIQTYLADNMGGIADHDPIRDVEWQGPEEGPYYLLGFEGVPNNTMPLPPVALLRDLHDLSNRLFIKMTNQANRQKTVAGVRQSSTSDGNRILHANDGEMIRLDDPNSVREFKFGGVDNVNLAFFLQVKDLLFQLGGNLDVLGGLSPQSQTLGQDQILAANASQRLSDMQDKVIGMTKKVVRTMANYLWNDPLIDIPLVKPIEGTDMSIPTRFAPELREGDFIQYNVEIHPYSMAHQTPISKMNTLFTIFDRLVAPYIPLMQQQGMGIDFNELFDLVADYTNLPELRKILEIVGMPEQVGGPSGGDRPLQSPNTTRTNVRVNRPGATRRQSENALTQVLLNGNPQGSETATIGRPQG